ncbi:acylneuraminate cytidylyltransferase family protein [Morganella morganii subsp. morganii]|uniref:acylneuraminate cytidylyltransferase family protein n=1 Tax=Morganella morganii TaxID=582 RepID=UPI0011405B95|nr:acylneuraminate cytidylyltransferase family protein [Morganella morganii]MBT0353950.1 acylneuraminate cytidylyltransferase family protein [Morganella morganii subsp. morganii]MBT0364724.1 acylneuraminate cytidylyltransferase family protein [Morganella morganii subsp. morganii]TPW55868.1 acylneuraminate cytidylyltransferase family protein [Morganella morganii]HDS6400771.1 acylneuraminate cytidylyltransferase family protein [Morganella morganii subsp. morganii]
MINKLKVMAIIPARGGSKRLPKKNILPLADKPLIHWTIEAAQKSKYVDNIFVSTDDKEIANISRELNIFIPELRPPEIATDETSTNDVLNYTINKFAENFDIILLLQPTSPLRTAQHIDEALEFFIEKNASAVISVTSCEYSPLWTNPLPSDLSMNNFIKEDSLKRSQELEVYYRINGAIYILNKNQFIQDKKIRYTDKSFAYIMPPYLSIDIDNELDFQFANFIMCNNISKC